MMERSRFSQSALTQIKDAKGYIDSYCAGKKVILLTGDEDEVEKAAKKFESSECLRVCISKH